jgi:hypothetical protein
MAVYNVQTHSIWSRVDFGSNYGIFQRISSGYRLITGGLNPPSCTLVTQEQIPLAIYQSCQ